MYLEANLRTKTDFTWTYCGYQLKRLLKLQHGFSDNCLIIPISEDTLGKRLQYCSNVKRSKLQPWKIQWESDQVLLSPVSGEVRKCPLQRLFYVTYRTSVTIQGVSQVWLCVLYVTLTPCATIPQATAINNKDCSHFPVTTYCLLQRCCSFWVSVTQCVDDLL